MTLPLRTTLEFICRAIPKVQTVLEIGSLQEKDQEELTNLRPLFPDAHYLGVDMRKGQGVDRVLNAQKLPFQKEAFDVVLCLETLEHAEKPWLITHEIQRVIKKNGTIIVSAPFNHPIHFHPSDYYRFTPYGLSILFPQSKHRLLMGIAPHNDKKTTIHPYTSLLVASNDSHRIRRIKNILKKQGGTLNIHKPYRHRLGDCLKYFKRGLMEFVFRYHIIIFRS